MKGFPLPQAAIAALASVQVEDKRRFVFDQPSNHIHMTPSKPVSTYDGSKRAAKADHRALVAFRQDKTPPWRASHKALQSAGLRRDEWQFVQAH